MEKLKCSDCQQFLEKEKFHKDTYHPRGFQYVCIQCSKNRRIIYKENNKEHISKIRKDWRKKNFLKHKNQILLRTYGISLNEFNKILKNQKNACAICKVETNYIPNATKPTKSFYVDHCHETQKVRGLLCYACNLALGYFRDSTKNLAIAIKYLRKHGVK